VSSSETPIVLAASPAGSIDEDEHYASVPRRFPPLGTLFQPRFMAHTIWMFAYVWFASRPLRIVAWGLPAFLVGLAVIGFASSVRRAVNANEFVLDYRKAYVQAIKNDDQRARQVALNSLLSYEPDNHAYRYELAELRMQQNRIANGIATMRSLADESNYGPAHLWLARRLFLDPTPEKTREAIGHLKEVVKKETGNPDANAMLGEIYLGLKQPSLAESFLRRAADSDPDARMKLAACLTQMGRIDEARLAAKQAESAFRSLVEDNAENSAARILWAHSLRVQRRFTEARSVLMQGLALSADDLGLRRAIANMITINATGERSRGASDTNRYAKRLIEALQYDSENLTAISQLAKLPLEPGQIDEVLFAKTHEYLTGLAESHPDNADALTLLAWAQRMQGDDARAIETMQDVIRDRPDLRLSLAQLYRISGQPDLAENEAKTAVEYFTSQRDENPEDPVAYLQLALAIEFLGDESGAKALIDAAQQTMPHPQLAALAIRLRLRQFDTLQKNEVPDRAQQLKLVDEILGLDPENAPAVNCLAALMRTRDDVGQQAKNRLQNLLSISSKFSFQIHSLFGALAEADGDFTKAEQDLNHAHRIQPNDPVVCNNLAHVLANVDGGDLDKALELANYALSKLPNHPEILETRGEILVKMERFSEALTDLESCLGKSGDPRDVHRYLAAAYKGLNDPEMSARHEELSK
jgi:predicted Zn-dependent protease